MGVMVQDFDEGATLLAGHTGVVWALRFAQQVPAAGVAVGNGADDFDNLEGRGEALDDFVFEHAHLAVLRFFFGTRDVVEGVEMIVAAGAEVGDDAGRITGAQAGREAV